MPDNEREIRYLKNLIDKAGRRGAAPSPETCHRFVELAPTEAASVAQYWHDFYVTQKCDVYHMSNRLSRKELEVCKWAADGAEITRDALVRAGATQPARTPCRHGEVL